MRYTLLRLKCDRVCVIGTFDGAAYIAFDFTLEHPDMVEALVLVSANLNSTPDAYNKMFERATEAGKAHGAAAAAQVWGNDPYQGPQREAARPRVLQIIEDNIARFRHFDGSVAVRQLHHRTCRDPSDSPKFMLRLWSSRARTTTSTPEPTTTSGPRDSER